MSNYRSWKRTMEIALATKRKLGFVNGAIPKETEDPVKREAWIACNNIIVSWIINNVCESIKQSIMFMSTAKDMWRNLEQRFQASHGSRRYHLSRMLYGASQQGKAVNEYFTELQIIWEELQELTNYPPISDMNTEMAAYVAFRQKLDEEQRLFQFLNGLDETYSAIRSTILMVDPLPTAEVACRMISQEESQRQTLKAVKEESEGLVMYSKASPPICSACGKTGHVKEKCWTVVGFPPWFDKQGKGKEKEQFSGRGGGRSGRGNRGGRFGRGAGRGMVASAQAHRDSGTQSNNKDGNTGPVSLTAEQLDQLLKLLPSSSKFGDNDDDVDCNYAGAVVCNQVRLQKKSWILDTGATHHMTYCDDELCEKEVVSHGVKIDLPNGEEAKVACKGTITLHDGIKLKNVMLVPTFKHNLISVQRLVKDTECEVVFKKEYCVIQKNGGKHVVALGVAKQGLYILKNESMGTVIEEIKRKRTASNKHNMTVNSAQEVQVPDSVKKAKEMTKEMMWHQRLGHAPLARIKSIQEVKEEILNEDEHCLICPQAKMTKLPFESNPKRAEKPFDLVHIDTWGAYRVPTRKNQKYFLTMVDDFSRMVWVHLMVNKSDAYEAISKLINMAETHFSKKVKAIRSDNAWEFEDEKCRKLYTEKGIHHETSCINRPQQNARVERRHRNLLEMARALRMQAGLPVNMWGDCLLTAVHINNRLPTKVLANKSPYEVLFNSLPDYKCMKTFGCLVMAYNPHKCGDKFKQRGVPCVFLGYPQNKRGYKLLNLLNNQIFISRDTKFYEGLYPYRIFHSPQKNVDEFELVKGDDKCVEEPENLSRTETDINEENESNVQVHSPSVSTDEIEYEVEQEVSEDDNSQSVQERRSSRESKPPSWMKDYYIGNAVGATAKPQKLNSVVVADTTETYACFSTACTKITEPQSFREAITQKVWVDAMNEELSALEMNNTWDIVSLPQGKHAIGCKWVYRIKYNSDGSVERHKARLVVLGNKQKYGEDYDETFAPVAKMTTVRSLLAVASIQGWIVEQMDVKMPFCMEICRNRCS
ncbi:Retrovirus-related Pol polyprotein from transposon TNT 1-94 [Bienertia sinuspersici]